MKFNNSYILLGSDFYSPSKAKDFSNPQLIILNKVLADQLGFNLEELDEFILAKIFSGNQLLEGSEPISQVYAAHQFGHFVPILGDGRAILLGEVIDKNNRRFDVQLKGAGPTKYSRRGDGFSALGPVLREFIVSEFMNRINIPSTRALAAVATNEKVIREKILAGGVLTRVASSHIRIGTFQYFYTEKSNENLRKLLEHSINRHYPQILNLEKKEWSLAFLKEVIRAQSSLVSKWMSVGFIHGVMNTDNMTVSGETIDFGPCAFIDKFDFNKVFSYIDQNGRYKYSSQPNIMQWNLARLADTLIEVYKDDNHLTSEEVVNVFNSELSKIPELFQKNMINEFSLKLFIENEEIELRTDLVMRLLKLLHDNELDFTSTFRSFGDSLISSKNKTDENLNEIFDELKKIYFKNNYNLNEVGVKLNLRNPIYIPRNHLIEEVIEKAYAGDFKAFYELCEVLNNPFLESDIDTKYKSAPLPSQEVLNTFCGT